MFTENYTIKMQFSLQEPIHYDEEVKQSNDGQSGTPFESTAIFQGLPKWVANLLIWWKCTGSSSLWPRKNLHELRFHSICLLRCNPANWKVHPRLKHLQPILSARHGQMSISNVTPLSRSRLAPLHVFVFRRSLSKLLQYSRTNALRGNQGAHPRHSLQSHAEVRNIWGHRSYWQGIWRLQEKNGTWCLLFIVAHVLWMGWPVFMFFAGKVNVHLSLGHPVCW